MCLNFKCKIKASISTWFVILCDPHDGDMGILFRPVLP